jgi:pyruvate/2-oxoglutarate dehydrogenase complex dihydrolipoamide dehydrogenase (E3) component
MGTGTRVPITESPVTLARLSTGYNLKGNTMDFTQAAAARGIDVKRAITNLKRRLKYQSDPHSEYVWPTTSTIELYATYSKNKYRNPDRDSYALSDLKRASAENDVQLYVKSWCYLNGLTA